MKKVFGFALCGLAALGLVGCAGMTPATIAAQAVSDLQLVDNGLVALTPLLSSIPGISPTVLAEVAADLGKAEAAGQSISGTLTESAAQPIVQQIETDVNGAVTLLASFPLPASVAVPLKAVQTLLPVVEAAIGMIGNVGASATGMTADQARAELSGI